MSAFTDSIKLAEPILERAGLRDLEQAHAGVEPPLMERAGRAAAGFAMEILGGGSGPVQVLCGPGNNGGDGYVLARELRERGCSVQVVSADPQGVLPADADAARTAWLAAGGRIDTAPSGAEPALIVDALFGIGLTRPMSGLHADWAEQAGASGCPVLALDIPSGLDAISGARHGLCVQATHTASFLTHKPGLLTLDGPDQAGALRLFDLGVEAPAGCGHTLAPALFAARLQPRRRNVHKGSFGTVGIIGGAAGMQGAALLAARAALHLGAGKIMCGLLEASGMAVDPAQPELMLRPAADLPALCSVLAVGPGLGQGDEARALLGAVLAFDGPLLLDADALNLLALEPDQASALQARRVPAVLTPHPAEAARLLHCTTAEVQADRLASARALAQRYGSVVVLKGCGSVIVAPDGNWFINTSGHAGMAAGGMGDVLSGLIAALLAQGWAPLEAAGGACHLHGCAAEALAARGVGPVGLTPSETILAARDCFNAWLGRSQPQPPSTQRAPVG